MATAGVNRPMTKSVSIHIANGSSTQVNAAAAGINSNSGGGPSSQPSSSLTNQGGPATKSGSNQDGRKSATKGQEREKRPFTQQPVEGLRDFKTQELKLLQAIRTQHKYQNSSKCTNHKFCTQGVCLLDEQGGDESYPMSTYMVPFDRPQQQLFMARNYSQRNHFLKQRLLMEGKVRAKEGEYDGVAMIVPVKESIADWMEQSKQLGQLLKERQQSQNGTGAGGLRQTQTMELEETYGAVMDLSNDTLQRAATGPALYNSSIHALASPRNERNGMTQFISQSLKVKRHRVPFLPINPSIHGVIAGAHVNNKKDSNVLEPYMSHIKEDVLGSTKLRASPSKYQTYSEQLKLQAERANEEQRRKKEMAAAEKLRPVTLIRSQQGDRFIKKVPLGDQTMQAELAQQQNVINAHRQLRQGEQADPSGESTILLKRGVRATCSQPAIAAPRSRKQQVLGRRDRSAKMNKIQNGTQQLFEVYQNQKRLAEAKKRLAEMGSRCVANRQQQEEEEYWSIAKEAFYKYDLRENLQVEQKSDLLADKLAAKAKRQALHSQWQGMVSVQDATERLRKKAEQVVIDVNTKLNPIYEMKHLRSDHALARTRDYINQDKDAKHRVMLAKKKGMESRVESYKEELRVYEYMVAKDYVTEAQTEEEIQSIIRKFKQMTAKHPERSVKAVLDKWAEEEEMRLSSFREQISTGGDEPAKDNDEVDNQVLSEAASIKEDNEAQPIQGSRQEKGSKVEESVNNGTGTARKELSVTQMSNRVEEGTAAKNNLSDTSKQQDALTIYSSALPGQTQSRQDHSTVNSENRTTREPQNQNQSSKQWKTGASRHSVSQPANGKRVDTYLDPEYWYHKGVVLNQNESALQSALNCYKQALQLNPEHTPSIFNLACNYQKNREPAEAKVQFEKAIKVQEDWPDAYYGLTLTCIELNQTKQAVAAIEKAIHYQKGLIPDQIKYVRALAYKVDGQLDKALSFYQEIMKDEKSIWDYSQMLCGINEELRMQNLLEDSAKMIQEIDLFHSYTEKGLLRPYDSRMYINLWEKDRYCDVRKRWVNKYYEAEEGWLFDKVDQVLDLLKKLRFFNRFEPDQLQRFLCKVTLRTVKKGTVLFLDQDEAAILVAGQLHLFNHDKDVACPSVQAVYNPGDILGIGEISNQWTRRLHDWLVARNDCDIFVCSREYMMFMWHIQKKGLQNNVVEMVQQSSGFSQMSEQTLYTIANDLAQFKEFEDGEVIVHQDQKSKINLHYLKLEMQAMKSLKTKDKEYVQGQKLAQRCNYPSLRQEWDEYKTRKNFNKVLEKIRRDIEQKRAAEEALKKEQEKAQRSGLVAIGEDTISEDCNTTILSKEKLSNIASPKQLTEEEKKKQKQIEKMPHYTKNFKQMTDGGYTIMANQVERMKQMEEKMLKYRSDMEALPKDANGIYLIVSGQASVKNQYDEYDFGGQRLNVGDHCGTSKFITMQGFSYFGDIIATKQNSAQPKTRTMRTLTNQQSLPAGRRLDQISRTQTKPVKQTEKELAQDQDGQKREQNFTTCLFIPENRMYLIPFYDYYTVRELSRTRPEFDHLRKNGRVGEYIKKLRQFNRSVKRDSD